MRSTNNYQRYPESASARLRYLMMVVFNDCLLKDRRTYRVIISQLILISSYKYIHHSLDVGGMWWDSKFCCKLCHFMLNKVEIWGEGLCSGAYTLHGLLRVGVLVTVSSQECCLVQIISLANMLSWVMGVVFLSKKKFGLRFSSEDHSLSFCGGT